MLTVLNNHSLEFKIDPPVLASSLSDDERDKNIILLDMQADVIEVEDIPVDIKKIKKLRFDMNVAFAPISVSCGEIIRNSYYIGCTGAEVFFKIDEGEVIDFTKGVTLNVAYENEEEHTQNDSLNFAPEITLKTHKSEGNFKVGEIKYNKSKQSTFSANFFSEERPLESVHTKNTIRWHINLPRGLKVVRDFLLGNLYLYATCKNDEGIFCGKVKIKPFDVVFFGPDKKPLNIWGSIRMHYLLYLNRIEIVNIGGFETSFIQKRYEN